MSDSNVATSEAVRPSTGLPLLAAGLAIGILADATLRVGPWGLGASFTAAALLAAALLLQRRFGTPAGRGGLVHAGVILLAAAGLAWRDAAVLKVLDGLVLAAALALLASERAGQAAHRTLAAYLARAAGSATHAVFGTPLLIASDVPWSDLRGASVGRTFAGLLRGLLLALPILVVFATLLAKADPVFHARLAALVDIDILVLTSHVLATLAFAWIAAGWLRAAVQRERPLHEPPILVTPPLLGPLDAALVLGLVDALFAGFVWIQIQYLFGGAGRIQEVAGLTYSEYARRGFFELVAVTALVLPLLLALHWAVQPKPGRGAGAFAALAGTQVVLVLVMLASALERMRLYCEAYGLTQLRLYTTAFMVWLGVLLVWLAATVLHGRRAAFARGALASAVLAVVALHVLDPERRIVEANRAAAPGFDADYAAGLSADAVPALLDTVWHLDPATKRRTAETLLRRWSAGADGDWRTWSVSRQRARAWMEAAEPALREAAGGNVQASAR